MKKPTYQEAVAWIADEDSPGDEGDAEEISGYLTACLVADLFDVTSEKVARDVVALRKAKRKAS